MVKEQRMSIIQEYQFSSVTVINVCDKCCKDSAHRGHQKYLKPDING